MITNKTKGMNFLCGINPLAGKDDAVIERVKEVFGDNVKIQLLEEDSDIYVFCENSPDVLDKLKVLQADKNVIDTSIEVIRTSFVADKEVRSDNVFLVLADIDHGMEEKFIDALKKEVDKVGAGDIELLYVGEIFTERADVVALLSTNINNLSEINKRVRNLPGITDSLIYYLRHTEEND